MEWVIGRLLALLIKNGAVRDEEADTYRYGLDLLLSSIVNILSILLLGLLLGRFKAAGLMLLFYIPLQSFGGGYHAGTHWRCYLITLGVIALSVYMIEKLPTAWLLAAAFPCFIVLFFLAPVEHANAPFSASFAAKMRKTVRIVASFFLLAAFLARQEYPLISSCLSMSLIMSMASLLAASSNRRYPQG